MQQVDLPEVTDALSELGRFLGSVSRGKPIDSRRHPSLGAAWTRVRNAVEMAGDRNPWFIRPFVEQALLAWEDALQYEKIDHWIRSYDLEASHASKTVGVVMAGNLPMVGFHDMLCVLVAGHRLLGKLSSDDSMLMPALAEAMEAIWPGIGERVRLTDGTIGEADAYIATGSNNTARYFEYYFGKYPCIIRRNRNGIAVLDGKETNARLHALAQDILLYFGRGCRNVSKVYFPEGFDPQRILDACSDFAFLADHSKYRNNYDYQKSILLVNRMDFMDNGFLLAREAKSFASPVSMLHLERFQDLGAVIDELEQHASEIQCIVAECGDLKKAVRFGESQKPGLSDYADQVDTMSFLLDINPK